MKRLTMTARILAAAPSTLAIAAAPGAASNVAYAALQLTSCDALLDQAGAVAELNVAIAKIDAGHEEPTARWEAVGEQLVAAASDPTAPVPPPAPGVTALTSFKIKSECLRGRDWPSDRAPA
jgi:hypothetical protein